MLKFISISIGGLLLARVVAVTFCQTLAASLAARFGPIPMAAFQTCLQVWLTSSLLADGLAVAVQVHKHFSCYHWFVKSIIILHVRACFIVVF